MKKKFKPLAFLMALCLLGLCCCTVLLVAQIQSYSKLVNYVGIVRGATQRLIKLELNGLPSDPICTYLDSILQELTTGEGDFGLVRPNDSTYLQHLDNLNDMWGDIKQMITDVRNGAAKDDLLAKSEDYFKLANETVFAAETYSNRQTRLLLVFILAMVFAAVLPWAFLLAIHFRRMRHLEMTNQDLSDKAYTDALTGIPNFPRFQTLAQNLLDSEEGSLFAVFYVDIDNFKYYNDVFGTAYGNELLKKYAQCLKADMQPNETLCRVSADNFLILRSYQTKEELKQRQESVDQKFAQYMLETKSQHLFTFSCGICCQEDVTGQQQIASLIERANFARKTVKNQPLFHYAFYNESIRDKMLSEKAIENKMYSALEKKEFSVYMQPKVDLRTNQIAAAEALVRWIADDGQIISPGEFIPVFERNMLIARLDQYVMEDVCRWLRERIDLDKHVVPISVNVSRMQLYDPDFVKIYAELKNKYRIPAGMLEIEFTESVAFENLTIFLTIVAALKKEGFRCSLDDFGKGYSSLNTLGNLPIDVLKLDQFFFDEKLEKEKADIMITGIVKLIQQLDIEIVAEGVEHMSQVEFLRKIGCDLVQGYVFYKPMPSEQFSQLLDHTAS